MRISSRVHLVASGKLGCSLTHPADCNVYAVSCGSAYILVDTGAGLETSRIPEELVRDGIDPARIEAMLLTHAHLDHSGGASFLHKNLGIPVYASAEAAVALEMADEEAISLSAAHRAGIYGADVRWNKCPVKRVLTNRDSFRVGDSVIRPIATPGHSRDMLSYLVESSDSSLLFPGDTVFYGGKILLQATWDCDLQAYIDSIRRLGELRVDGLYPGHGIWSRARRLAPYRSQHFVFGSAVDPA